MTEADFEKVVTKLKAQGKYVQIMIPPWANRNKSKQSMGWHFTVADLPVVQTEMKI